eukprot:15303249-Alexandrium_andersonii.AAC.1
MRASNHSTSGGVRRPPWPGAGAGPWEEEAAPRLLAGRLRTRAPGSVATERARADGGGSEGSAT